MPDLSMLLGAWHAWKGWTGLGTCLARIVAAVSTNLWRAGCAVAVACAAVQQVRIEGLVLRPHVGSWSVTLIDRPGWRPRALAAEQALAQVEADQPKAAAAQIAVNHQPAALSAAIAKASDDDAKTYYAAGRAAGAAYAAAHGLRAACADGGTGDADLPGADRAAPLDDRSGSDALDVTVSRADYDRFVVNSLRLAKVHQDAESLIAAGVAEPAEK